MYHLNLSWSIFMLFLCMHVLWLYYECIINSLMVFNYQIYGLCFLLIKEDLKNMLMEVGTKMVTQLTLTSYPIPWKEQSYSYYSTFIGNNSKLEWHSWKHS